MTSKVMTLNIVLGLSLLLCAGPAPASSAEILVLTPFGSRSVRFLFSVLTEGLAAKGHAVTFMSSGDPIPLHSNVTHVESPHTALDQMDLFELRESGAVFRLWKKTFPIVAREMYANPRVMNLWRQRHKFDAIIVNSAANEMAFPFLMDLKAPFITLAPTGAEPLQLSYLGNLVSPAALPTMIVPYDDHLTLWERLVNTLTTFGMRYAFRRTVGWSLAAALKDTFPELPEPYEVYPKQSLNLINRHHLLDGAIPLLPNQVEVGCMHCRPSEPLPQDIAEWLDGAGEEGVIYFSLGSFQKTSSIPPKYREALMEAFALLPHRILIKFNASAQLPPNVKAFEWLPQQDILGHRAVRAFVTHCGKHSVSEAVYHGVPVLGLPITFDQPRNCARLSRRGEGLVLQWEDMTPQAIVNAIYKLVHEEKYRNKVAAVSNRLQAQKETGLERAVWWIEYIIEYGNDNLKFSGVELSLAQYLLLDVLTIVGIVALIILGSFIVLVLWTIRDLSLAPCLLLVVLAIRGTSIALFILASFIFLFRWAVKRFWPSVFAKATLQVLYGFSIAVASALFAL